nr:oligopeptide/dipeptide ABC transporter ATP-binding protein [Plastoroseomonas arctica]
MAVPAVSAPLLELRDVARTYRVGAGLFAKKRVLTAVAGVSLQVGRGEVLGLVGESGCGKSTLARIILGLEAPSAGEVFLDGRPIGSIGRLERGRLVQPIFQDPYSSLNPRRQIASIVGLPLDVHGIGTAGERRDAVAEMLALVGLAPHHATSFPAQLSGRQRQRVAIARALVLRPALVVCDEPTSALDVSVQSQILNLLMDLRERLGLAYLFISHNLAVVHMLAARAAAMYLGRVVEQGEAQRVLTAPRHPYTAALLASVLTPDASLGLPQMRLGTVFPNPLALPTGCSFHPRCPLALERCSVERPPLRQVDGDGLVACHLAQ